MEASTAVGIVIDQLPNDFEPLERKKSKKRPGSPSEADEAKKKKGLTKIKKQLQQPVVKRAPPKPKTASCRYDSSLGLLTKKFVVLLQEAKDGVLDLNTAAAKLEVQKRRIYDITNVLEGIGLIEKKSKNNIQWKGSGLGPINEMRKEMGSLKSELDELNRQELMIDEYVKRMQDMLKDLSEHEDNSQLAYVTHDDIRRLPNFKGETLIAIKAPSGTTLEVPDPDDGMEPGSRRYQIYLKSNGAIDVYLVSQHEEEVQDTADSSSSSSSSTHSSLSSSAAALASATDSSVFSSASGSQEHSSESSASSSSAAWSPAAHSSSSASSSHKDPKHLAGTTTPLTKLEPPPPDPDYFFNLTPSEGISNFFAEGDDTLFEK